MTTAMQKTLAAEIDFMDDYLAFPGEELHLMETLEDARIQIEGMSADIGEDLPAVLKDPETMLLVFNHCVQQYNLREKQRIQEEDDANAARYPDSLRFRNAYENGSSAFFDLDMVSADLFNAHYDAVHLEIILAALKAACQNQ